MDRKSLTTEELMSEMGPVIGIVLMIMAVFLCAICVCAFAFLMYLGAI